MEFYLNRVLEEHCEENSLLRELVHEFQDFKEGKEAPRIGRDRRYRRPRPDAENARLMHNHIMLESVEIIAGSSDRAIVYAHTTDSVCYIIDILLEDAHAIASSRIPEERYGNRTYIEWAIREAENFERYYNG